jgi:hypothetical protein
MMLHVSQSVVLDYFTKQTTMLPEETLSLKKCNAENLGVFRDILQQRTCTALEWGIIALILVEIINLVVEKSLLNKSIPTHRFFLKFHGGIQHGWAG